LNAGTSVAISTTGVGSDAGNITVNAPIERTIGNGAVNLTLTAHTNININNAITVTGSGSKLELTAGNSSTNGSITLSNTVKADTLSMNITGTGSVTQSAALETNNLRIYGQSASVTLENTSPTKTNLDHNLFIINNPYLPNNSMKYFNESLFMAKYDSN
jgi:hypothetical protein